MGKRLPFYPLPSRQAKTIMTAIYFGCDHVVWAGQAGIYADKVGREEGQDVTHPGSVAHGGGGVGLPAGLACFQALD